jgi:hypothetical protein
MDCCDVQADSRSGRHHCPRNGREYRQVPINTVRLHLNQPWQWQPQAHYYYCTDPACPVIYFADDDSVLEQADLRTPVGLKDPSPEAQICYCFGVTRAESRDPAIRAYVEEQTRQGHCACEIRNPSGRCCLADFPKS